MNNRKLMVANIINSIISVTGMNFQQRFTTLLSVICSSNNLTFEKIQPSNGDAKNDGWIPEKNIYFAMYSPSEPNISQLNQINNKLSNDLDGLCDHIYLKGHWGKEISKFYFVVNTHDKDLSADPERIMEKTIRDIKLKYEKEFQVEIIAAKEIKEYLLDLDSIVLEKIADNLDVFNIFREFSVPDVLDFIDDYTKYLVIENIESGGTDYSKVTVEKKIELNDLNDKKEYILGLIASSDKIEQYLKFINSEGMDIGKHEKIKDYIILKYNELALHHSGKKLYDCLIEGLIYNDMPSSYACILESVIVNIFIKCDIFKKE